MRSRPCTLLFILIHLSLVDPRAILGRAGGVEGNKMMSAHVRDPNMVIVPLLPCFSAINRSKLGLPDRCERRLELGRW